MFSFKKHKFCGKKSNYLLWWSTSHGSCGCWVCWGLPIPTMWRGTAQSLFWFTWAGGDRAHGVWQHRGLQKALYTLHSISKIQSNFVLVCQYRWGMQISLHSFSWELGLVFLTSSHWCMFISTWGRCRPVTILTYPKFSYDVPMVMMTNSPSLLWTETQELLSHRQLHPDQACASLALLTKNHVHFHSCQAMELGTPNCTGWHKCCSCSK